MCGIAGFSADPQTGHGHQLGRMLDAISYRGPDGRGTYSDEDISIGSLLLAIVDVRRGHQPFIRTFDGRKFVGVVNGEIYNYRQVRTELAQLGLQFSTDCDSEVAVAAFAVWGTAAAERLDGQWALALWDAGTRQLLLSRDRFGIKPLFYYQRDGFLAFASEPKALLALPNVPRRPNVTSIREYFLHGFAFAAGYSLSHRSFFEGIHSLPPGHVLRWTAGGAVKLVRQLSPPVIAPFNEAELADAPDRLLDALQRSTQDAMMGEAPVAVALSGGLDSSIIATVAATELARRGESPLLASCIRYRTQGSNEDAEHATLLRDWLDGQAPVDLVFSTMDPASYLHDVDDLVDHFDEPHWEVKQLAMFNNYRCLRSHGAKVVLTGEGADELFFGYYHRFPGFKNPVLRSADDLRTAWANRLPSVEALLAGSDENSLRGLQDEAIDRIYRPAVAAGADPDQAMQQWYLATFLHWLLLDNDRCSMAFSLEGRFPFLSRDVFELALRIPPRVQVGDDLGGEKLVLRQAFKGLLPEGIWKSRKKAPLPSPLGLQFHRLIAKALQVAIDDAPPDVWDVLSRDGAKALWVGYAGAVDDLERRGALAAGGEELTRYLRLDEPWSVRTPHAFGLLTLLRWWRRNFS
ncbi:MAG: asparagine synthase (glutamine-hydrolyzing) [Vicinamibacterales bacterium]